MKHQTLIISGYCLSCLDWSVGGGITLVTSLVIAVIAGLVVLPHRLLHHHDLHPGIDNLITTFTQVLSLSYLSFYKKLSIFSFWTHFFPVGGSSSGISPYCLPSRGWTSREEILSSWCSWCSSWWSPWWSSWWSASLALKGKLLASDLSSLGARAWLSAATRPTKVKRTNCNNNFVSLWVTLSHSEPAAGKFQTLLLKPFYLACKVTSKYNTY